MLLGDACRSLSLTASLHVIALLIPLPHRTALAPFHTPQRQTAIKKDMEVVQDLGYSKIKELLRARGLTDAGDRAECLRRYLKLRERDLDAITSGSDLSYFGKELVGRVFSMVKNAAPKIVNYIRTQAPDDPLQAKKLAIAKMKGEALPPPDTDMIHAENADSFLLWDMNRLLTGTEAWGAWLLSGGRMFFNVVHTRSLPFRSCTCRDVV